MKPQIGEVKKKKKRSVKFASNDVEENPVPEKRKRDVEVVEENAVKEDQEPLTKKQKRMKKKKDKRLKNAAVDQSLLNSVIGPSVETVHFSPEQKKFSDFNLDERLLKVVGEFGWELPTQVQESVIDLALEDKNIMARARTGSGKTGAFLLPVINKIINYISGNSDETGPFAVIVGPTKELATQIFMLLTKLLAPLPFLTALNLSELSEKEKAVWEKDCPSIVVSTPGKIASMLRLRDDFCRNVRHLVLDEADLLLSYGYENEMTLLKEHLPASYQCILTSATLTDDMTVLKKLFMTGPVVTIKLKEGDLPDADQLAQYHITCQDEEQRFAIMVAMIKLKLIVGKSIVFVNSTDRCYKLALVLRSFGVRTCVLNSEMPANSRCHVINQFNNGLFNIIIASDSADAYGEKLVNENEDEGKEEPKQGPTKKKKRDKEAGVSRGIDFHNVSNVVNFDFPTSTDVYIHRVGRTARGWNKGTALSFCTPEERPHLDRVQEEINSQLGRTVLTPYEIRVKELDSFLLRTREALTNCTRAAIKRARLREIKLELMRSSKLEGFFAANPREKDLMKTTEQPIFLKVNSQAMSDVPDYMVPQALKGMDFSSDQAKRNRKKQRRDLNTKNRRTHQKNQKNPLKSFKL